MDAHNPDEYLPVEIAGNVAGISPRTLRSWVRNGKVPAIEGQRGKLVRLGDVLSLVNLTGKSATLPASERQIAGNAGDPARSATGNAGNIAAPTQPDTDIDEHAPSPGSVSLAARSQLEAIRDEWLRPLVDRIGELEREAGRLQAERDAIAERLADDRKLADQLVNVLQAERDTLAAEVERLRADEATLVLAEDRPLSGPSAPIGPPAWRTTTTTGGQRKPWWRVWWERWQ